ADGRREEYGFGVGIATYEGHRLIYHAGGIPGFHTFLARFVDDQTMIAVLANNQEIAVQKITRKIARHIFGLPALTHTPVTLSTTMLDKAAGTYRTEDGLVETLQIVHDEKGLAIRGFLEDSLLPINEAAYYASQDEEIEVHFTDEQDAIFNVLSL